ncbi:DUF1569 domain-containing protein [Planctomycetota bacterium]|nr:DUF1569 domain-containing protein [Planctomycetota bacterium]
MKRKDRMDLRFETVDEGIAYAEKLVEWEKAGKVKMGGKWTLAENFSHLEKAMQMSVDGPKRLAPKLIMMGAKLRKNAFLNKGLPSGIPVNPKLADLKPEGLSAEEGLVKLKESAKLLGEANEYKVHPVFGELSDEEVNKFHCRHMELHLSHAVVTG